MLTRTVRALIACLACLLAAIAPPRLGAQSDWYRRSLVGMEVGPTGAQFGNSDPADTRYCARFNGAEIVRRCVAAHCEYLVLWARDGDYAYYNSKLLPKAPGLGGRDPLRDAVAEARRQRIPLIAYCVVQQGGHYLNAHPEFRMRDLAGNPIGRFCLNSGYLEAMKHIVDEQLAYGIDGFHIDMLDQGFGAPYGCWCDSCRAEFRRETGHAMPTAIGWDAGWDEMLEFRYRSSVRFERELRDHVKFVNPKASIDFNYHGNPPFSFEVGQRPVQHAINADFVTGETGQWGFSALGVGLNAEFYRAATPGAPFQVAMQRGVRMYHDQTTRPLADIRWELFTLLAHGAFVTMVDKTGLEGDLDPAAYRRIAAAFAEARRKRTHFGQKPVYDLGIYFSSRTRDWFSRERPSSYFQSFQGAQKACAYEHLSYGVLLDENLTLERMKQFPAICLPNAACLSDREVGLFRAYIAQGGGLIVTGWSGQFDRMGAPARESALAELIGARFVARLDSKDNWMQFDTASGAVAALRGEIPLAWPFLVKGPAAVYRPTTATSYGRLRRPSRTTRQREGRETADWPMSAGEDAGPAILVNRIGKGAVVTFAGSPDFAAASEHHIAEARHLLRYAYRFLCRAPRVEISAPANVEAIVTDDPRRRVLRVHLIAYQSPPQTTSDTRPYVLPGLMEDTPLYRVTIKPRFPVKTVGALNTTTVTQRSGGAIVATVNDVHEALLLSY